MSQSDVARAIGTTPSFISQIEGPRPERLTSPTTIANLGRVLDVNPDRIYAALGRIPPDLEDNLDYSTILLLRGMVEAKRKDGVA